MNAFKNIVITKSCLTSLILTVILLVVIPFVFIVYWRNKHPEIKISYLIAGAIGFIVSVRVLELVVHYVCIISTNPVSKFINGNDFAYVAYGIVMAGIFEECGRYVILKYIMKKNRTRENAVLYGIGHGGMEILAVILPAIITYLVIAIVSSLGNMENAFRILKIDETNASLILPTVQSVAAYNFVTMALNVVERILTMVIHIELTVIVYKSVTGKKKWLFLAVILHMMVDLFPAMYQRSLVPLFLSELWCALWAIIIAFITMKLYQRIK